MRINTGGSQRDFLISLFHKIHAMSYCSSQVMQPISRTDARNVRHHS